MDNTDIFILNKGKTPILISRVEAYNKEILNDEIRKLMVANVQLITDKMETEKVKVNLEADKIQLFNKKNSLVIKKKEFRAEIVALNTAGPFNILIRSHQDPLLRSIKAYHSILTKSKMLLLI